MCVCVLLWRRVSKRQEKHVGEWCSQHTAGINRSAPRHMQRRQWVLSITPPAGLSPSLRTEGQYFNVCRLLVLSCFLLVVLFRGTASTCDTHRNTNLIKLRGVGLNVHTFGYSSVWNYCRWHSHWSCEHKGFGVHKDKRSDTHTNTHTQLGFSGKRTHVTTAHVGQWAEERDSYTCHSTRLGTGTHRPRCTRVWTSMSEAACLHCSFQSRRLERKQDQAWRL